MTLTKTKIRILIAFAISILIFAAYTYAASTTQEYGYVTGSEIITESGKHISNYKLYCENTVNDKRVTVVYHKGKLEGIYTDNTGILVEPQN